MAKFDLGQYWDLFPKALQSRYQDSFEGGFRRIASHFEPVGQGKRKLNVDDVMTIFDADLPFVKDWTKPDEGQITTRIPRAAEIISKLAKVNGYEHNLISELIGIFGELTLTALVLQHVDPTRFAMCSNHISSLLRVTGQTVPEFYIKYCEELKDWSERQWPTRRKLNVLRAEYALWTWYRLAFHGKDSVQRREHQRAFKKDRWVQQRRAEQIAQSLRGYEKLDIARSYLKTGPTIAAIIAWRQFGVEVRKILEAGGEAVTDKDNIWKRIDKLPAQNIPARWTKEDLKSLWWWRNEVMKDGDEIAPSEAERILNGIEEFLDHNEQLTARLDSVPDSYESN
jgi:hypothetical protein